MNDPTDRTLDPAIRRLVHKTILNPDTAEADRIARIILGGGELVFDEDHATATEAQAVAR